MNGLVGGRKGQGAESLVKANIYYYSDVISIVLCVQGNRGTGEQGVYIYVIELNVHLLVADGIERLFVGGILSKHSS